MADQDKLEKFIESELQVMSPLLVKSSEILQKANSVVVNDRDSLIMAKHWKKKAVEHRTSVKDMRLAFTRKLDGLKASFIEKQDEILAPSIEAEAILKERIGIYEDEQRKIKEAEAARIQAILEFVYMPKFDRTSITEDQAIQAKVDFDMRVNAIDKKDRNKKAIKDQIAATRELFEELITFVHQRDEQRATAIAQEKERRELEQKQRDLQANMEADKARVESKLPETVDKSPVAPEGHSGDIEDDDQKESGFELPDDLGWECNDEISKIIDEKIQSFKEHSENNPEDYDMIYQVFKAELMDAIYLKIKEYQTA